MLDRLYHHWAWSRLHTEPDEPDAQVVNVPQASAGRTAAHAWSSAKTNPFARLPRRRKEIANHYNRKFETQYIGRDYMTSCLDSHILATYNGHVPVSLHNHSWWTPLHAAAAGGHDDVIQLLLVYGADIDAPSVGCCDCTHLCSPVASQTVSIGDKVQWTPAHLALCGGHDKTAKELFRMNASLRIDRSQPVPSALFSAARHGCSATVEQLLRGGSSAHGRDLYGLPPLFHCLAGSQQRRRASRHVKVAKALLRNCADPRVDLGDGCTLLHAACYYGWTGPVQDLLMEYCKELVTKIWHGIPGFSTSAFRAVELLAWLHYGYDKAHHARFHGHALAPMPPVLAHQRGPNPTLEGRLHRAEETVHNTLQHQRRRLLTCLFDHFGPAIAHLHAESTYTPLNAAIDVGSVFNVRLLVKLGISVHGIESSEPFPLLAAVCPDEQIDGESDLLLWVNRLSPPRVRYEDRAACRQERLRIVEYLLEQGADVNQQDDHGNTALAMACIAIETSRDNTHGLEIVDHLLDARADPNIANTAGDLPLDRAISMNNANLALRLIRANAVIRPHHDLVCLAEKVILSAPASHHGSSDQQTAGSACSDAYTSELAELVDIFTRIVDGDTQHRILSSSRVVSLACRVAYYPFARILLEKGPPHTSADGALGSGDHSYINQIVDAFPEHCAEHRRAILQLFPLLRIWGADLDAGGPVQRALSSHKWTIARELLENGATMRREYLLPTHSDFSGDIIEFLIQEEPRPVHACPIIKLMLARMTPQLDAEKLTMYLHLACRHILPDVALVLIAAGARTGIAGCRSRDRGGLGSSVPVAALVAEFSWKQLPQRTRAMRHLRYMLLRDVLEFQQDIADWRDQLHLGVDLPLLS